MNQISAEIVLRDVLLLLPLDSSICLKIWSSSGVVFQKRSETRACALEPLWPDETRVKMIENV